MTKNKETLDDDCTSAPDQNLSDQKLKQNLLNRLFISKLNSMCQQVQEMQQAIRLEEEAHRKAMRLRKLRREKRLRDAQKRHASMAAARRRTIDLGQASIVG